ncbi:MAG: sugar transferase [Candidatus Aminicenantes bacterium]|nr:sugar transferase [Candidatus Aminicenantes bacterium]
MMLKKISKRKLLLLVGDLLILLLSLHLAYLVRMGRVINIFTETNSAGLFLLIIFFVLSFYVFDQYNVKAKFLSSQSLILFGAALLAVAVGMAICFYFFPFAVGRGIFFYLFFSVTTLAFGWRVVFSSFFRLVIPKRRVLIVGLSKGIKKFAALLKNFPEYKVVGYLNDVVPQKNPGNPYRYLGARADLEKVVNRYEVDDIVVASGRIGNGGLSRVLINCRLKGKNIYNLATFYEQLADKLPVLSLRDQWLVFSQGFDRLGSNIFKKIKRSFDILSSVLLIVLCIPLGLLIALLIKLTSRGPVFYIQERLGQDEKPFRMLKFRTMVLGAENEKPRWAEVNDHRVTAVGRVLRKTRLDELPQLLNVLKGEMSLIGPRPEREYFVKILKEKVPYYSLRFAVKPGITGWAQVNYRYGATVEDAIEKLRYDLYYIKNMSLFLDLRILLKTIRICLLGMGGR